MLAWFSSKGFTKKSLIKETPIHLLVYYSMKQIKVLLKLNTLKWVS